MNEPATFRGEIPEDVVFSDEEQKTDHARMHNVYGHLMAKATYEGLKEADGRRPFVITRPAMPGHRNILPLGQVITTVFGPICRWRFLSCATFPFLGCLS